MKTWLFFFMVLGWVSECQGQTTHKNAPKKITLTALTFHSSPCNGSCPEISMNLYKNKRIEISRNIFKSKGQVDTALSGNFKGYLTSEEYKKITGLVEKINWDKLKFPKVFCCDGPVRTIIISYNGKYKRFKSMTPPLSTQGLIEYLITVCTTIALPKYDKPIHFEVV